MAEATPACVLHDMCKGEHYEMKYRLPGNSRLASRVEIGFGARGVQSAFISSVNHETMKIDTTWEGRNGLKRKVTNKAKRPLY
jgi:hypothetical protein